jgi:hypothetical protein
MPALLAASIPCAASSMARRFQHLSRAPYLVGLNGGNRTIGALHATAKSAQFAGNLGGEGEIRTHGACTQRFSSLGQGVRGGPWMTDSRGNRPICGASSPPLFAPVATGCCYRRGVDRTSSLGACPRSLPRTVAAGLGAHSRGHVGPLNGAAPCRSRALSWERRACRWRLG